MFTINSTEAHWYQRSYVKLPGYRYLKVSGYRHFKLSVYRPLKVIWLPPLKSIWLPPLKSIWLPPLKSIWLPPLKSIWLPPLKVIWRPPLKKSHALKIITFLKKISGYRHLKVCGSRQIILSGGNVCCLYISTGWHFFTFNWLILIANSNKRPGGLTLCLIIGQIKEYPNIHEILSQKQSRQHLENSERPQTFWFHDKWLSRYTRSPKNQIWTDWPQTELDHLTVKNYSLHTKYLIFGLPRSTTRRFRDTKSSKIEYVPNDPKLKLNI